MHLSLFCFLLLLLPPICLALDKLIEIKINTGLDESAFVGMLDQIDKSFLAVPNDEIWSNIPKIDPNSPFFFFHQRKAGGEGIRDSLYDAAKLHNLKSYIICQGKHPVNGKPIVCDTYHLQFGMKGVSVFAGHLSYGEQFAIQRPDSGHHDRRNISCTTNFREPISRVLSCLRYRHHIPCLATLSAAQFEKYLVASDEYGQSCLSEPFRIMSGVNDEDLLDFDIEANGQKRAANKMIRKRIRRRRRRRRRRLDAIDAIGVYKRTLIHVAECAPIVLEIPVSFDLVADRCPAIFRDQKTGANVAFANRKIHVTMDKQSTTGKCAPSKDQTELLLNHTWLERRLYDVVYEKTEGAANYSLAAHLDVKNNTMTVAAVGNDTMINSTVGKYVNITNSSNSSIEKTEGAANYSLAAPLDVKNDTMTVAAVGNDTMINSTVGIHVNTPPAILWNGHLTKSDKLNSDITTGDVNATYTYTYKTGVVHANV